MPNAISITGLREYVRALKAVDADLPKGLRVALNEAANLVVDDARPKVPRRTGRAAASIKARSTRNAVRVSAGGRRAPYYPWLDWGGKVGRNKSVERPIRQRGRYIYPAYDRKRRDVADAVQQALIDVAKKAGLDVTSGQ